MTMTRRTTMSNPLPVVEPVIVDVDVIEPVIVAVHVNGNDTVIVIDPVDVDSSASKPSDAIAGPITSTVSFPFTCTATGPITSTSTSTITDTITAPRMTMLRAQSNDQVAPGRMTM